MRHRADREKVFHNRVSITLQKLVGACYNDVMLKIFDGNTGNYAAERAILTIRDNDLYRGKHVVIVPDRFAMSVEKEIFDLLGIQGAFNIDVVSFTRLAIKKLRGRVRKCLTKEGAIVLTTNIIIRRKDDLQFFKAEGNKRTLAKDVYAVIASMRTSGITPKGLKDAFSDESDAMRRKYHDIALIYEDYEEALKTLADDTLTRLAAYEKLVPYDEEIKRTHFYVIGFNNFRGNEYRLISTLAAHAASVTVALNGGSGGENNELFSSNTIKRLVRTAGGGEVERIEKKLPYPVDVIYETIFSYSRKHVVDNGRVELFKEIAPHSETRAVGLEIKRLVSEGYRYKDIAVVTHDDSYRDVVDGVFHRLDIPLFIDRKYPLRETLLSRLLESYLSIETSGMERHRLFDFAANPLLGIPYEDVESLNDILSAHNINYGRIATTDYTEYGEGLKDTARRILSYYEPLPEKFTATEGVEVIRRLMDKLDSDAVERLFREDGIRDERLYEINSAAAELLNAELDEFVRLDDGRRLNAKELSDMLKGAVESVEVSLIPNVADAVFVGADEESRFFDKKVIFIIGASEGVMPQGVAYHAILPERDVAAFEKNALTIYPTPLETMREDKGALAELLTMATDKVYVSYSEYSLEGKQQSPGEFFKQLAIILRVASPPRLSEKFSSEGAIATLGSVANARYEVLKHKSASLTGEEKAFYTELRKYLETRGVDFGREYKKSPESLGEPLFKDRDGVYYTGVTEVERFYLCPYRHFLEYGLRARRRALGEADSIEKGNVLHAILEKFFRTTMGRIDTLDDAEVIKIADAASDEVLSRPEYDYLRGEDGEVVRNNLRREARSNILQLTDAIRHSSYRPRYVEYGFGIEESVGDSKVVLRGKIDRADFFDKKFFVIDYKTGKAKGKEATSGLYYGLNLQLYLYLLPFIDKGYVPTGAFYVPVNEDYGEEGKAGLKYVGKLTTDERVLKEMDDRVAEDNGKVSLGALPTTLRYGKKKGWYATENAGLSETDFRYAVAYAEEAVKRAVKAFGEGYIAKKPADKACEYCPYSLLCEEKLVRKIAGKKIENGTFLRSGEDG